MEALCPFSDTLPYAPLPFGCSWVIYSCTDLCKNEEAQLELRVFSGGSNVIWAVIVFCLSLCKIFGCLVLLWLPRVSPSHGSSCDGPQTFPNVPGESLAPWMRTTGHTYCILPCIVCTHIFAQTFREKIFHFNFLIQFLIYLHLDTCFLYYKGILAFIFENIMVQEILCNE